MGEASRQQKLEARWKQGIADRLRAFKTEFDFETDAALAELLGAQRTAVSNWIVGRAVIPVHYARALKQAARGQITLDWIYEGDLSGVPTGLATRLAAHLEGMVVPKTPPDDPMAGSSGSSNRGRRKGRLPRQAGRVVHGAEIGGVRLAV